MKPSPTQWRKWLLMSDIHFRYSNLDQTQKTAQWIVSVAGQKKNIQRAVICGDLFTTRPLSQTVPRINILLGNHDMAYNNDYSTTALDGLNLARLRPYVSIHKDVVTHEIWDDRRVLLLPFRQNQSELTAAVASLDPAKARETVAFGHLAINKAILQRYVQGSDQSKPLVYHGLIGPGHFSKLARTFTGHFHSHQVIPQKYNSGDEAAAARRYDPLMGSVVYLGAPLQLSWSDLHDVKRGVVLFDPDKRKQELLVSPHAVNFITMGLEKVLRGDLDLSEEVRGKNVMLEGEVSYATYTPARANLLASGAPFGSSLESIKPHASQQRRLRWAGKNCTGQRCQDQNSKDNIDPSTKPPSLSEEVDIYVKALELPEALHRRREDSIHVGRKLVVKAKDIASDHLGDDNGDSDSKYELVTPCLADAIPYFSRTDGAHERKSFVGQLKTLTITNFLSVQGTIQLNYEHDIPQGLTFVVGDNGSGKSTLIEAITWCLFGKCLRQYTRVDDVVNDASRKSLPAASTENCSVRLTFANNYCITRMRKMSKRSGGHFVVQLDGVEQPQLAHTQAALDDLLGTDYNTFVRTAVLGQENGIGFLSATAEQRRSLAEEALGVPELEECAKISKAALDDIANVQRSAVNDLAKLDTKLEIAQRDLENAQSRHDGCLHEAMERGMTHECDDGDLIAPEDNKGERPEEADGGKLTLCSFLQDLDAIDKKVVALRKEARYSAIKQALYREKNHAIIGEAAEAEEGRLEASMTALKDQNKSQEQQKGAGIKKHPKAEARNVPKGLTKEEFVEQLAKRYGFLEHDVWTVMRHYCQTNHNGDNGDADYYKVIHSLDKALDEQARVKKEFGEFERRRQLRDRQERQTQQKQLDMLLRNREVYDFWANEFSKSRTKTINFRAFVRSKRLGGFNYLASRILLLLHQDSRHHSSAIKKSAMGTRDFLSLLYIDGIGDETVVAGAANANTKTNAARGPPALLDPSLDVGKSLTYAKRSSGERKRIDLAVFFALLATHQAHSSHCADYLLVVEVFDSLDAPGMRAIMRFLCTLNGGILLGQQTAAIQPNSAAENPLIAKTQQVSHVVVITHSPWIVGGGADGEDEDDDGQNNREDELGALTVITARKGLHGTEFEKDGKVIGRGSC
ncbi:hypothetical protein SPI_09289 [Niveomyces insectorum RCEF 264]|uniref:Rad50/SbcC-type AAA domain-containing protein n=1 Tax=Niveomyces insectorum RCEF 264 TaxID=1081102 RepID=A0A167LVV9_9HYPO|nr:hypothetical protein SPI_09289 [Niveomyces insectorum RCEF 264]